MGPQHRKMSPRPRCVSFHGDILTASRRIVEHVYIDMATMYVDSIPYVGPTTDQNDSLSLSIDQLNHDIKRKRKRKRKQRRRQSIIYLLFWIHGVCWC